MHFKKILILLVSLYIALFANVVWGVPHWEKGIYINQPTLEDAHALSYLIQQAKQVGINTFVIDFTHDTNAYRKNIALVKRNNLKYVARIVVFSKGGNSAQVTSKAYWQKKYNLVQQAIAAGAQEIQLDYIRYSASQKPSARNVMEVYQVIRWFKQQLKPQNIPLQIDVFGEVTFGRSLRIGQDLTVFADTIDAACPMLYPSHYEPYREYAKVPYFTVLSSLRALRFQFDGHIPFKVYPYIELSNYRYPLSKKQKLQYIYKQIRGVEDGGVNGWYAWSPNNKYDNLFRVLRMYKSQLANLTPDISDAAFEPVFASQLMLGHYE